MNFEMIAGLLRHGLTFGGGFVAQNGWASASDVELAVGAVMTLVGIVWSAWTKKAKA